jgi:hypothetical protein
MVFAMSTRIDDLVLSQLADGELSHDETVGTLLAVLDDEESRDRLRQHLQLRQMSAGWRSQQPSTDLARALPAPVPPTPLKPTGNGRSSRRNPQGGHLLVASVVGGLLVVLGVWIGKSSHVAPVPIADGPQTPQYVVTPSQRQQIAQVFAFHESVAGPLKCFAADDRAIEITPADAEAQGARPLAVVLRLTAEGGARPMSHEYVIVCRQGVPVAISLPHGDSRFPPGRLYLSPAVEKEGVGLQYSLTMDDAGGRSAAAAIAGRRNVGSLPRSLGELALGDQFVRVEASAWPLDAAATQ